MFQVLDEYHRLPNGMFSADEHFAGQDPSQGTELCTVVEAMFSLETDLAITGDAAFGDRLEKIAYNALPATITEDFWAHQYDQQPNQVMCSLSKRNWSSNGPESNIFGLEPNFGCCTANMHQGWPKLAASLWMATNNAAWPPLSMLRAKLQPLRRYTSHDRRENRLSIPRHHRVSSTCARSRLPAETSHPRLGRHPHVY